MSTETTVRETIKTAIEGIAIHGLGFDSNVGAVKDHPLEYVREEVAARYLSNAVNGSITFRVWSVFVESREEAIAITSNGGVNVPLVERFYTVKVAGYYKQTADGEALNTLIDHARKVRGAVYALGSKLGNNVDRFLGVQPLSLQMEDSEAGGLIVGTMVFEYAKRNPTF